VGFYEYTFYSFRIFVFEIRSHGPPRYFYDVCHIEVLTTSVISWHKSEFYAWYFCSLSMVAAEIISLSSYYCYHDWSIEKVRNAVKAFCSSQCWSCANIDSAVGCCTTDHFLCSCVYDRIWPWVWNKRLLLPARISIFLITIYFYHWNFNANLHVIE